MDKKIHLRRLFSPSEFGESTQYPMSNHSTVIDRGNHEQYFKALTVYGSNNPSIDVLVVEEFADSEEKPFMLSITGEHLKLDGLCEAQHSQVSQST